jgi:putative phage-type endonuclease
MKIIDCVQGTQEWLKCRAGIPSSSNFDMIVTTKGERSKQAEKYMFRLAGERLTGMPEETYQSAAMARGVEMEEEARSFYELTNDVKVEQVGFCVTDDGLVGCSPDGLVGEDGMVEIKCPLLATCVSYLLNKNIDKEYFQQLQGQLYVTGRKWVDIISYYPALKPLVIRVERDDAFLKKLDVELKVFCRELEEVVDKIK